MRRYCTLLWKTLAVPLGMVGVVLLAILIWSFGNYGGVRYGFDRLSGYTIVPVQSVVDLGEVEAGQTVIAQFRLKNLSKNNVTILGTESDCSCTAFDALPLKIPPYAEVELPVSVVVAQNTVGSIANAARLFLDIDQPQITLVVKANVSLVTQK